MFEMVAVGGMAMTLEFRIPVVATRWRKAAQSSVEDRSSCASPLTGLRDKVEAIDRQHSL